MRLFRRRPTPVPAALTAGFWSAEAAAMQRAIRGALRSATDHSAVVPAELELTSGIEGRVVVHWGQAIAGFVPGPHAAELRRQLHAVDPASLLVEGRALHHEGLWRVWVGPPWPADEQPPPLPADELEPPQEAILGIPLRRKRDAARTRPATAAAPAGWILAVGAHSWEVRDGADLDLTLLRRRIADAGPGDTLHLRLWGERVTIELDGVTPVTLTDAGSGAVEALHPRPGD